MEKKRCSDWSTPQTSRPPLSAVVTPTVAVSGGPLSPLESEEEGEWRVGRLNDVVEEAQSHVDIVKLRSDMDQLTRTTWILLLLIDRLID